MGQRKNRRSFRLKTLFVLVCVAAIFFSWVAQRRRQSQIHRNAVLAVCALGGSVDYDSGIYSGDLDSVFPQSQNWIRALLPAKRTDYVNRITFQRSNGPFWRSWPGRDVKEFSPDWSYESMMSLEPHLRSFHSPKWLDFSGTVLPRHGLKAVENLKTLESLLLSQTQITSADIAHLSGLTNLKYLRLRRTRIDDSALVHLRDMKQLETLQLGSTQIGDDGVKQLESLVQLKSLWLDNTQLTDEGMESIGKLKNLTELRVDKTTITDAGLVHLEGLTNLERLCLPTSVTSAAKQRFEKSHPNCKVSQFR